MNNLQKGGRYADGAAGYSPLPYKRDPLVPTVRKTEMEHTAAPVDPFAKFGSDRYADRPGDTPYYSRKPAVQAPVPVADVVAPTARPSVRGSDATMPANEPSRPSSDPRLAALGVKGDWNKLTEAAGQPIQNAEIYATGRGSKGQPNSFAGYGTQTPEKEAADRARADAAHARTMGTYERESQARLGARVAAARLRGEDAYADSLEKQAEKQATGTKAKAELAAQEGLGAMRAAQTKQTELGTEQAISKQAMTDEYLKADTTPERRKALAAALGIKPEAGWQISTTFGPPGTDGQPTKSTIAHRTTASGELETRDLSGGTQPQGAAPVEGMKSTSGGKPIIFKNGKWVLE